MKNNKFTRKNAYEMFEEMSKWLAANQITQKDDPNLGAVYFPTEDRFCNRDTACMVRAFMRMYKDSGNTFWYEKAVLGRDYVLGVQKTSGGYPELRGRDESDQGSTVNTSIIAENLIKAYELGLEFGERDFKALFKMADFILTLEWKPGAFYHDTNHMQAFGNRWGDEGSHNDCQNTTSLAAVMLKRIYYFLKKNNYDLNDEWLKASDRAISHLIEGQNETGQWPYLVNAKTKDAGHHSMCIFYLTEAAYLSPDIDQKVVLNALRKGAQWLQKEALLKTERGTKINWAVNYSACLYFTTEYFLIAASLARISNFDNKNGGEYRYEAAELLRYVRRDLWNNANYEAEGPFRLTEAGVKIGYAWFGQSMGWVIYKLDELMQDMGWRE